MNKIDRLLMEIWRENQKWFPNYFKIKENLEEISKEDKRMGNRIRQLSK